MKSLCSRLGDRSAALHMEEHVVLMHIEGGELDKSKRRGEDKLEHKVSKELFGSRD